MASRRRIDARPRADTNEPNTDRKGLELDRIQNKDLNGDVGMG